MRRTILATLFTAALMATPVLSSPITFETRPNGSTPTDDSPLANPYTFNGGTVRFFFDANGNNRYDAGVDINPVFEHIGDDGINGFASTFNEIPDTPRPGYEAQLGNWFLRTPGGNNGSVPGPFIAAYTTSAPIRALSGEIWDIDGGAGGTEQWRVDVLSTKGAILSSKLSPLGVGDSPSSLDSLPWTFQFENLPDGVASVRLTFVGSKTNGVGLAFNNFSPDVALPEPTSALPLLILGGIYAIRRWR